MPSLFFFIALGAINELQLLVNSTKGVYREEGMQLTMYRTYSSNFVSETGYAKNRIQYMDVNKWAVLFTEL